MVIYNTIYVNLYCVVYDVIISNNIEVHADKVLRNSAQRVILTNT